MLLRFNCRLVRYVSSTIVYNFYNFLEVKVVEHHGSIFSRGLKCANYKGQMIWFYVIILLAFSILRSHAFWLKTFYDLWIRRQRNIINLFSWKVLKSLSNPYLITNKLSFFQRKLLTAFTVIEIQNKTLFDWSFKFISSLTCYAIHNWGWFFHFWITVENHESVLLLRVFVSIYVKYDITFLSTWDEKNLLFIHRSQIITFVPFWTTNFSFQGIWYVEIEIACPITLFMVTFPKTNDCNFCAWFHKWLWIDCEIAIFFNFVCLIQTRTFCIVLLAYPSCNCFFLFCLLSH